MKRPLMRRSISQTIVNWLLPVLIVIMFAHAVWSVIRPWIGY